MPSSIQYRSQNSLLSSILQFIILCTTLLCFSCSESPEQVFQRLDAEAEQYFADKQYDQAISKWNNLLSLQPEAKDIYPEIAKSYQLSGRYTQALHAFQKHLKRAPGSLETLVNIMNIQIQLLDIEGARASWEKLKLLPPNPMSLTTHGDLLAAQRQFLPAIEEYQKALVLDPNNQLTLARLAVTLVGQHKIKEAQSIYSILDNQHPNSPDILLQMGNYWLLLGDNEKCDLFLKKAILQVPDDQNLQIKLADLYIDSGHFTQAVTLFKKLLQNSPTNRFYKKMLLESLLLDKQLSEAGLLLSTLSTAETEDVDFLLLKGKYYLNRGEHLVAASQFELALKKEPGLPITHYFLALSYLASGQNNVGRSCLIKSLTLDPYFTAAELALADCYYKNGEYELALKHVTRIQLREPEHYRTYLLQGMLLTSLQKYDGALEAFRKAYILNTDNLAPQFYIGILFSLTGHPEQALPLFKTIIDKHPLLADATLNYAQTLTAEGYYDNALIYLKDLINTHPASPYLHHIYGLILLSVDKKQDAIKAFQMAIQIAPEMKESYLQLFKIYQKESIQLEKILLKAIGKINNFEEALTMLAALYSSNGQTEKAIALLQEALVHAPNSPVLANNLAYLYLEYQPANIDEAMRLAALAYDKVSDSAAITDTLGWAYYKKNNLVRARWLLNEAVTLEPNNSQILFHLNTIHAKNE